MAGKAVRDGLFLSQFSPADLPKVMAARRCSRCCSGLGFARRWPGSARCGWCRRLSPSGRCCTSSEFALLRTAATACVRAVVTVVYLHLVGFGAILLSGFWSVANEVFDPREAKRHFGRIAGGGNGRRHLRRPAGGARRGLVRG